MAAPTCAELEDQLEALRAAKQKYLLGQVNRSVRAGEKEKTREPFDLKAVNDEIGRLQMKVDACNGTRGGRVLDVIPRDNNDQGRNRW